MNRPPARQATNRVVLAAVRAYRAELSGSLSAFGVRCRMRPTCSSYAEAAFKNRGAVGGAVATLRRLLRCGPWTPEGTVDKPPRADKEVGAKP